MRVRHSVVLFTLLVAGCAGPTAQEKYDTAERDLERAQQRLDNLRPAYDTARASAINAVCQEIAGTTPDDAASAALAGLGDVLNGTTAPPAADAGAPPAEKNSGNSHCSHGESTRGDGEDQNSRHARGETPRRKNEIDAGSEGL
jgi:hypothetical protein